MKRFLPLALSLTSFLHAGQQADAPKQQTPPEATQQPSAKRRASPSGGERTHGPLHLEPSPATEDTAIQPVMTEDPLSQYPESVMPVPQTGPTVTSPLPSRPNIFKRMADKAEKIEETVTKVRGALPLDTSQIENGIVAHHASRTFHSRAFFQQTLSPKPPVTYGFGLYNGSFNVTTYSNHTYNLGRGSERGRHGLSQKEGAQVDARLGAKWGNIGHTAAAAYVYSGTLHYGNLSPFRGTRLNDRGIGIQSDTHLHGPAVSIGHFRGDPIVTLGDKQIDIFADAHTGNLGSHKRLRIESDLISALGGAARLMGIYSREENIDHPINFHSRQNGFQLSVRGDAHKLARLPGKLIPKGHSR